MKNVASFIKLRALCVALILTALALAESFAQTTATFQFDTTLVRAMQWRNIGRFAAGARMP